MFSFTKKRPPSARLGGDRRRRQRHPRDEGGGSLVVVSVELSAMRFYNRAAPVKTEPVMALAQGPERFPPPVLGGALEVRFRFGEGENVAAVGRSGGNRDRAFAAFVTERIREQFQEGGEQQLRID